MSNEGLVALEKVLKAYPELVKTVYTDGASGAIQEIGGLMTDLVKGARLITAPVQYMAHLQDRLSNHFRIVESSIKKENQISPPPQLFLPLLEKLKYQDNGDVLTHLYVELLKRACDKERLNEAHPAFINIIPQLSSDEALFVYHLSNGGKNPGKYFLAEQKGSFNNLMNHIPLLVTEQPSSVKNGFTLKSSPVVKNLFPLNDLAVPDYISLYASHLKSLNLIQLRNSPGVVSYHITDGDVESGKLFKKDLVWYDLTLFGELFAKACIPQDLDLTKMSTGRS